MQHVAPGRVPASVELLDADGAPLDREIEVRAGESIGVRQESSGQSQHSQETPVIALLQARVLAENGEALSYADIQADSIKFTLVNLF